MGASETRFLKVCPDELALHRSWLALRMDFTEYGANFHIAQHHRPRRGRGSIRPPAGCR
jgi:hypothetical protein